MEPAAAARPPRHHHVFTPDERNAMRGYLQRCEVRLSTMHRIAVGFLSGSGLLFLLPIFLKDGVLLLIRKLLEELPVTASNVTMNPALAAILFYFCLLYPFIIALAIPVLALGLLVKDTVRFYFVGHPPGFPQEHFNPRFGLTAVAFSPDESEEVKQRVLRYEYGTDLMNFVITHADGKSRYYSAVIDKPHRMIVPRTRKLPRLIKQDVMDVPSGKPLDQLEDEDFVRVHGTYSHDDEEDAVLPTPYVVRTLKQVDRFNAALGLAGMIDRPLVEEVAKTEVSLARHNLKLRRLVLRYFEALLILMWTGLIIFLMQPFLLDERARFSLPVVFGIAFLVWALLAPFVAQLPIYWLVRYSLTDVRRPGIRQFQKTDGLQRFGKLTQRLCYVAVAASLLLLLMTYSFHIS